MADTRFERELRDFLTVQLDAVHGPHPRWASAPVARRIGRVQTPPSRRPALALFGVLAAAILVAFAFAVAVFPRSQPVATQRPTAAATLEALPTGADPSMFPTLGEVALGRVAIATQNSAPALAVRVMTQPSRANEVVVRIDIRVVGPITTAVGSSTFGVVHDGRRDQLPTPSGQDALAIPAGAPIGTTVTAEYAIPVTSDEWADLAYYGTSTPAFTYPIHRPAAMTPPTAASCPTLADYAAASMIPSDAPTPSPSFDPVASDSPPTTGSLAVGSLGIVAGPDGHPGALVRVSNARFCDRLPDSRPDAIVPHLYPPNAPAQFLFADVDLQVLQDDTLDMVIPNGDTVVVAQIGGQFVLQSAGPPANFWYPGINTHSSIGTGAGYRYHGTMAWAVQGGDYAAWEVTIGIFRGNAEGSSPLFSYAVRPGAVGRPPVGTPTPATPVPSLTPATSPLPLDTEVVLPVGGATVRAVVGGVQQVPRYPAVVPSRAGDVFLEYAFESVRASDNYVWDPADWTVTLPDGSTAKLLLPPDGQHPNGWPNYTALTEPTTLDRQIGGQTAFFVVEVPATGRITLAYRPNGGPAVATWVLREQ